MPRYIVAKDSFPELMDNQIAATQILLSNGTKKTNSHGLSKTEVWNMVDAILQTALGGGIISFIEAQRMIDRFLPERKRLIVSRETVQNFLNKISADLESDSTPPIAVPSDFDLGLRFYVGKNSATTHRTVVVPVAGPRPAPGSPRRHEYEQEPTLFINAGKPFFGLVPALLDSGGTGSIETDTSIAHEHIMNKDESGVEMVYFLLEPFRLIISKLNGQYRNMLISFARTGDSSGNLTLVLMFLDEKGDPVFFEDSKTATKLAGVCFDQGDLMPPPPPPGVLERSI